MSTVAIHNVVSVDGYIADENDVGTLFDWYFNGVTAGIDFGLVIVAELFGEETAKEVQLSIEYDPKPPFSSGSPEVAEAGIVEKAFPARTVEGARRSAARLGLAAQ
jgi:cyclohexyl-isocyanide hydratase